MQCVDLTYRYTACNFSSTSITSHNYHFLFFLTFMIYAVSNFQIYNIVLLYYIVLYSTIITMLCIRSSDLFFLKKEHVPTSEI